MTLGIIPSRYQSTRFPGKPLAMIDGKSMIQRVYEQASQCKSLSKVVVATDDDRIFNHVKGFGGEVVMTSASHQNGTERCAEALTLVVGNYDGIINIQGDEPFIQPQQIDLVAECLAEDADIATLIKRITDVADLENTSVVKAIMTGGKLSTFSRKPDQTNTVHYKHIGIYGYRTAVLQAIAKLQPSESENLQSLEQLRWLDNGYKIKVKETKLETQAIDTQEDLQRILKEYHQ